MTSIFMHYALGLNAIFIHVLEELTPQPHSLIGLDLELLKRRLKIPPKVPVELTPECPSSGATLGAASAALGPAL